MIDMQKINETLELYERNKIKYYIHETKDASELHDLVMRQEKELAEAWSVSTQMKMVGVTAAELSCVINWLEGGRDPKDAAKELRLYCERAWTGTQPVQQPASPENLADPLDLVGWLRVFAGDSGYSHNDYADVMRQAAFAIERLSVQQPAPVAMQEPERFDNKQSREYLVRFMENNFTDKTYHRYIRAERVGNNLAGGFAWQMARALRIIQAAPVAAPVADTTMSMALEMVDACMDATQVEPEDAAAWQIVRNYLFSRQSGSVDNWVFRNDGSEPDWAAHQAAEERDAVPAASVQPSITPEMWQLQIDALQRLIEFKDKRIARLLKQPDSERDAALAKLVRYGFDGTLGGDFGECDKGPYWMVADVERALAAHPANVAQLSELASTQRQVIELQAQLNALLLERNASGSVAQAGELSDAQTEQVVRKVMEDWHIEDGTHLHWERSVTDLCQALAAAKKGG